MAVSDIISFYKSASMRAWICFSLQHSEVGKRGSVYRPEQAEILERCQEKIGRRRCAPTLKAMHRFTDAGGEGGALLFFRLSFLFYLTLDTIIPSLLLSV